MVWLSRLALALVLGASTQQAAALEIVGRVVDSQGNARPGATVCAFAIDCLADGVCVQWIGRGAKAS